MPRPPANARITNVIRIASGSTFRCRPRPPATPAMTESDVDRVSGGRGGCGGGGCGGGSGGICWVGASSRRTIGNCPEATLGRPRGRGFRQVGSYPGDERDMTSERTQAYGRVLRTLQDVGPTKLHPPEQERIRDAADTLIFAATVEEAHAALADVDALAQHLAATERWSEERA